MNIVFCCNSKVFDGLLISIISILKHNKQTINFYVVSADLQDIDLSYKSITLEQINFLSNLIKKTNPNNGIKLIDGTSKYHEIFDNKRHSNPRLSPYANLRLLLDYLLPKEIDKILYLDIDVICNNNLSELISMDISDYEIACVRDDLAIKKNYFNSGVLLMNMKKMKQMNSLQKTRDFLFKKRFLIYADQTALNKTIQKKLMLDIKYNYKKKYYYPETVLHHFTNVRHWIFHRVKPWEVDLVKKKMHNYDDILDEYLSFVSKDIT